LHCRSTPELDQLRAHLSALMPHRVAAGVLAYLLPVEAGKSPETLRRHTLKIGEEVLVRSRLAGKEEGEDPDPRCPAGRTTPSQLPRSAFRVFLLPRGRLAVRILLPPPM
jgi:hypothetical protein